MNHYQEARDSEIGLMLQQDPRVAEANRELEQEAAAAHYLAFANWAEDRKIPYECWDAWFDNGHIHPQHREDLFVKDNILGPVQWSPYRDDEIPF